MKSYALFQKDLHSELRTRYAINSLAMFIIVAISVILFSIGNENISPGLTGGLFWVVIFFSAMSGLSRAFVSEEERGTSLTLQLIASPATVFTGNLLFFLTFIFGNIGIAISSTLIAAIIAKAGSKGTLYPVLSFPILLPLILTSVQLTSFSIDGIPISEAVFELAIVVCYDIIMISASYMLFDFIWKD